MSDLEELYYFFGIEFVKKYINYNIIMSQNKCIEVVLKQFNIRHCKSIAILLEANLKLL